MLDASGAASVIRIARHRWFNCMFTFGREHEKRCAAHYLRDPSQIGLIADVVDAVHDVLEGKCRVDDVRQTCSRAFCDGGSGVWEQTALWMTKLDREHPLLLSDWRTLAANKKATVRFRVACCLNDMPQSLAKEIGELLANDRSKKVREMAVGRLEEIADGENVGPESR